MRLHLRCQNSHRLVRFNAQSVSAAIICEIRLEFILPMVPAASWPQNGTYQARECYMRVTFKSRKPSRVIVPFIFYGHLLLPLSFCGTQAPIVIFLFYFFINPIGIYLLSWSRFHILLAKSHFLAKARINAMD